MTRHPVSLAALALLALASAAPVRADCDQARALHAAAWAEPDPPRRIELLRRATAACPDPAALVDLATACLGLGDQDCAIAALDEAGRQPGAAARQPAIQAELARLYLAANRLGEASARIALALDLAGDPPPQSLLDLRRAIDSHPERTRLSAEQITRGLATRGMVVPRGFEPRPLDLYVLFDFNEDQPNAAGLAQVEELARALAAGSAGQRYRLIGHTDVQGPAGYNQGLSERRAAAVRRLVEARAPALAGRILSEGRGESQPKYPGLDDAAHRLNRRVELAVGP